MSPSEAGVDIQRRTLEEVAALNNINSSDLLNRLADQIKGQITNTLEWLVLNNVPDSSPEVVRLVTARNKLADINYAFELRQEALELIYQQHVNSLAQWLPLSAEAQAMLSPEQLEAIENQLGLNREGSLCDRAVMIARTVEIVSPLIGGFNAETLKIVPLIKVFHGVFDCIYSACWLMINMSAVDEGNGVVSIKDIRNYPKEFEDAVAILREIVEVSIGRRLSVLMPPVPTSSNVFIGLGSEIIQGAQAFVIFHELGHLLLPDAQTMHDNEHQCDTFAAHLLMSARKPTLICGLYMGMTLAHAILLEAEAHLQELSTHPKFSTRRHRVASLVEDNGLGLSEELDALLSIPTRLYEEEIFTHETRYVIYSKLCEYFIKNSASAEEAETCCKLASGVVAGAIRLPTIAESTEVTLRPEGENRVRLFTFEPTTAILSASVILKHSSIEDEKLATAIALECLAVLDQKPRPPLPSIEILHYLNMAKDHQCDIAEVENELPANTDVRKALEALSGLRCVTLDGQHIRLLHTVNLRLVYRPQYN